MSDVLRPNILTMDAVLWSKTGNDDVGQPAYAAPVAIKVRWEDVEETFIDGAGRTQVSKAKVYVGLDVPDSSALMLGKLTDLSGSQLIDPFGNEHCWEVKGFSKIPNRKGKKFLRWCTL